MNVVPAQEDRSWFRSAAGLRFAVEIGLIVVAKFALLVVLYFAVVAPQPRADTSAAAMRAHMLPPASADRRDTAAP
jgi:hypothetical protein